MKFATSSPCKKVCEIDEPSQLCTGCYRTIDEITRWQQMDEEQKLAVVSACGDRQQMSNGDGDPDSMDSGAPSGESQN